MAQQSYIECHYLAKWLNAFANSGFDIVRKYPSNLVWG